MLFYCRVGGKQLNLFIINTGKRVLIFALSRSIGVYSGTSENTTLIINGGIIARGTSSYGGIMLIIIAEAVIIIVSGVNRGLSRRGTAGLISSSGGFQV